MAIALDTTNGVWTGTAVTTTLSYTVGSGSNRLLVVGVQTLTNAVTGVTYGGVAMTLAGRTTYVGARVGVAMYYLLAPASGTANIVASFSTSAAFSIVAASYTGVKQSAQPDAGNAFADASGTTHTSTLTTVRPDVWMVAIDGNAGSLESASGGSVVRQQGTAGNVGNGALIDSNAPYTTAGSNTLTFTTAASVATGYYTISFSPFEQIATVPLFALEARLFGMPPVTKVLAMTASLFTTSAPSIWHNAVKTISAWINQSKS